MPTTRRDFIRITAVSGTALLLGAGRARADEAKPWRPNAWLRTLFQATGRRIRRLPYHWRQ